MQRETCNINTRNFEAPYFQGRGQELQLNNPVSCTLYQLGLIK